MDGGRIECKSTESVILERMCMDERVNGCECVPMVVVDDDE